MVRNVKFAIRSTSQLIQRHFLEMILRQSLKESSLPKHHVNRQSRVVYEHHNDVVYTTYNEVFMDNETGKYILAALVEKRAQSVWRSRVRQVEEEDGISFAEAAKKTPLMEEDVLQAFKNINFCKETIENHLEEN
tara:strand:+ start:1983 stop:2387 length:405 start_codon:yes stop_codon:yes gene_type:complete